MTTFDQIAAKIESELPAPLWTHTQNTIKTATELAVRHSLDVEKARLAALLHDYGKISKDLLAQAQNLGLEPNEIESDEPLLLHGAVAALIVSREFSVKDQEVLSAIKKHTFGGLTMSPLDKVLYISDMVEPDRDYPERAGLLEIAAKDLDEGFLACLSHKIQYVIKKQKKLHPITVEVWNNCLTTKTTIPKSY